MCLMGIVQNLFLAYVNTKVMKYKIHENNFDIANIWGLAHRLLQGGIGAIYFKGILVQKFLRYQVKTKGGQWMWSTFGGGPPHRRSPWCGSYMTKWWMNIIFGFWFWIWEKRNFCDMTEISAIRYKSRLFSLRAGILMREWARSTIDIRYHPKRYYIWSEWAP